MISCRELIDFLADYIAGDLSPTQRDTFEEHLAICPDCVSYLNSYKATIHLGKAALQPADDEIPKEVPPSLVKAILEARS